MTGTFIKKKVSWALVAVLAAAILFLALAGVGARASAEEIYDGELILDPIVETTASETTEGSRVYRSIAKDDTFTVTYRLIKNDGMVEGIFTPAYDKDAFELVSFSVDTRYWSLLDDYSGLTAEEYVADRNARYASGELEDFSLRFLLSYPGVRDGVGQLSDEFIRVVYKARTDLVAPYANPEYYFGFDLSDDGAFTNAAKEGGSLLTLLVKTGEEGGDILTEALSEDVYTFRMIAETEIELPEQAIAFRYDSVIGFYLDEADIELTFVKGDKDYYFEQEFSEVIYTFYRKDPATSELTPILDDMQNPAHPTTFDPDNIYLSARITPTDCCEGAETAAPVHIAILPYYVEMPDLVLSDDGEEVESFGASVIYGSELSLTVGGEDFFPADEEIYSCTFEQKVAGEFVPCEFNPIASALAPVGEYRVIITARDTVHMAFLDENEEQVDMLLVSFSVTKKALTLHALFETEDGTVDALNLTYGDAAPTLAYEVNGIAPAEENAILALLGVSVLSDDPYAIYDDVGDYEYYAYTEAALTNYEIDLDSCTGAVLHVLPKALTLSAEYYDSIAIFTAGGVVNGDDVTVTYKVGDAVLAGWSFRAGADEYNAADAVVAYVIPNAEATNYAMGSLTLPVVHCATFLAGEGFEEATDVPAVHYVFDGAILGAPAETPQYPRYAFRSWVLAGEPFLFGAQAVTEDIELTAVWEKVIYDYHFRAIHSTANLQTDDSLALVWNEQNSRFEVAAEEVAGTFLTGNAIPMNVTVKGFYVKRWLKVVPQAEGDPIVTPVHLFDADGSFEVNEGAYYLAEMSVVLGKGDVTGDGEITIADVLAMKKYLVGEEYALLADEGAAWDAAFAEAPEGGYFYYFLWDVNEDGSCDTRDVVTIREALATGYDSAIVTDATADGSYCPNEQIARADAEVYAGRVYAASSIEELDELLTAGKVACLASDLLSEEPIAASYEGDVTLYLAGHTLVSPALSVEATGAIKVTGGVLDVDVLSLLGASVVVTEVTDGNGQGSATIGEATSFGWGA